MKRVLLAALLLGAAALPAAAEAQQSPTVNQSIAGTRLDLSVTGESTRVPDLAIISAGVLSKASMPFTRTCGRRWARRRRPQTDAVFSCPTR